MKIIQAPALKPGDSVVLASDIHNTHIDFYGMPNDERMEKFVQDLLKTYEKKPFKFVLLLGDYALDHWICWKNGGINESYLDTGRTRSAEFLKMLKERLPVPVYPIPGNHEQYSEKQWKALTGFDRQYAVEAGDFLFILHDSFKGALDPKEHSDGVYSPLDVPSIRDVFAQSGARTVFLCLHHFDPALENRESEALIRSERVKGLFAGHVHLSDVVPLGEAYGHKPLMLTGNFSYSSAKNAMDSMWGWRELTIEENQLSSVYHVPESVISLDGAAKTAKDHVQDPAVIRLS